MKTRARRFSTFAAVMLSMAALAHAEELDEVSRMRDALRTTMIQLRDVNNRVALLEAEKAAEKAAADKKIASLEQQVKTLTDRSVREKEDADKAKELAGKAIAALQEQIAAQDQLVTGLKGELESSQKALTEATGLAEKKEQERAEAHSNAVVLQRRVDEALRVNAELHRIGRELLSRFEKFGLGDAVASRERFIGITRTKFENLMQDYQDQIDDHKLATP